MRCSGRSLIGPTRSTMCTSRLIARPAMDRSPARELMERARAIWEELKLPPITPQSPWHGYSLGDWADDWETFARRAVKGEWEVNGRETFARRRGGARRSPGRS